MSVGMEVVCERTSVDVSKKARMKAREGASGGARERA